MKIWINSHTYSLGILQDTKDTIDNAMHCLSKSAVYKHTFEEFDSQAFVYKCDDYGIKPEDMRKYLAGDYFISRDDVVEYLTILSLYRTKDKNWEHFLNTFKEKNLSLVHAKEVYSWMNNAKELYKDNLAISQVIKKFLEEVFKV